MTQLMPRILEQAYLDHYKLELSGNKIIKLSSNF